MNELEKKLADALLQKAITSLENNVDQRRVAGYISCYAGLVSAANERNVIGKIHTTGLGTEGRN